MKLPPLPPMSGPIKFDYRLNDIPTEGEIYYFTKEQMLQLQRDTVEACATVIEFAEHPRHNSSEWDVDCLILSDKIKAMLKELP